MAFLTTALMWGTSLLSIKVAVAQLPPVHVAAGRIVLGAITLLILLALPSERPTRQRVVGLLIGFAGVLVLLGAWRGAGGASLTGQLVLFGA